MKKILAALIAAAIICGASGSVSWGAPKAKSEGGTWESVQSALGGTWE